MARALVLGEDDLGASDQRRSEERPCHLLAVSVHAPGLRRGDIRRHSFRALVVGIPAIRDRARAAAYRGSARGPSGGSTRTWRVATSAGSAIGRRDDERGPRMQPVL